MRPNLHSRLAHVLCVLPLAALLVSGAARSFGDTVSFPVTNTMTGTIDTNGIQLSTVTWVDASGTVHTSGFPTWIYPTNQVYVWSNMPSGLWLAQGKFLGNKWFNGQFQQGQFMGPGLPGADQGILFWVGSSTNSYPFTQYPLSIGNHGYNAFTFNSGIYGASFSGGLVGGVTNGVLYINGSAFTPILTPSTITNGLGYIPANTNTVISTITPTNGPVPITLSGQSLFVSADTNLAAAVAVSAVSNNLTAVSSTHEFNLTNLITTSSNVLAAQSASVQTALNLSNSVIQAQITTSSNANALATAAVQSYSSAVSNYMAGVSNQVNNVSNSVTSFLVSSNQTRINRENWILSQVNCNTNFIMVSGGTGSYALLNGTNVWDGASPSWTNINNLGAISILGVYSVSAVNVANTAGGYPVGTLAAISGSGTLPIDGFSTNGLQVTGSATLSYVQGTANINVTSSGGTGVTTLTVTNNAPAIGGTTIYFQTNFDALGAAAASTNAMGLASGMAAFSQTNQFDAAGSSQRATNVLQQSAYVPTNTFDLAGAANTASKATTNIFPSASAAYHQTNEFDLAGAANSASSQVTNGMGLASQMAAFSNTNQFDPAGSALHDWKTNNPNAFPNVDAPGESFIVNIVTAGTFDGGTFNGNIGLSSGDTVSDSSSYLGQRGNIYGNLGGGVVGWTNFFAGTSSNSTLFNGQPTNSFDVSGAAAAVTNGLSLASGTAALANTNQFDPANAAKNSTNYLGLASGTAAFSQTNQFDPAQSALNSTNNIGIPSGDSAFVNTNRFDIAGAASVMSPTNSPTIWNATLHGVTSLGGNLWSTETNGVLGFTNWPSVNGFVNLTMDRSSSTLWVCTSNSLFSVSSNGATCSLISNVTTIATSTTLTGPWSMQVPGTGTPGGSYMGQAWNLIGVQENGGSYSNAFFNNQPSDVSGTYPLASNIATLNSQINITGSASTATNALQLGYVLITTGGYSGLNTWVPDVSNPIQDAFRYWTNFVGGATAQQINWAGSGLYANSNSAGGDFRIRGTFYNPSGWYIPNIFVRQGWRIEGDSTMVSTLIADTNVLRMQTNGFLSYANGASMVDFEINNLTLVCSNESMKGSAILNTGGAAQHLNIHDNLFAPYSCWAPQYFANNGGGSGVMQGPASFPPGVVGIFVDANDGAPQVIHDNIFDGCALGVVGVGGHWTTYGNQYCSIGRWTGSAVTNNFSTNDTAAYFPGYNIPGSDLAIGASVLAENLGSGDISIHDEYMYGCLASVMCVGNNLSYGLVKIEKVDTEAVGHDIIVESSTVSGNPTPFPSIRVDDSFDNATETPLVSYVLNSTTHVLSQLTGMTTGNHSVDYVFETTLEPSSLSVSNSMFTWRIDNVPVFVMDPSTGSFWVTNKLVFQTNGVAP